MCELGGAEDGGDPEGLFGAPLEGQGGRQVGAAVEVFLTAGQAQVQALVAEGGVLVTLKEGGGDAISATFRLADIKQTPAPQTQEFSTYLVDIQLMDFIRQRGSIFPHQRSEGKTKELFLPFVLS